MNCTILKVAKNKQFKRYEKMVFLKYNLQIISYLKCDFWPQVYTTDMWLHPEAHIKCTGLQTHDLTFQESVHSNCLKLSSPIV
jgi:hypothetical protein